MLPEDKRTQLDSIVEQMTSSGESDSNIRFVVDDFKKKYTQKTTPIENTYGASFRSSPNDNPLEAGLKAAGNLPSSALNFGKGIYSAIRHPINTISNLADTAIGGAEKLIPGNQSHEEKFNQFSSFLKERYGSLENLQKTATEDPFGFGSDVIGLLTGGAALAGKGAEVAGALSKTAQIATKPIAKAVEKTADLARSTAKFSTSQATGLNPETITELLKNPQAFREATTPSRIETATKVGEALDSRLEELGNLGKNYDVIRSTPTTVVIPEGTIEKVLGKYGVKLDKEGKIITTAESRPLSGADKTALQDFISNYGQEKVLSSNSFLNTREALSNLSKYEQGKTSIPQQIARDLRSEYDKVGKTQIKGLKELDAQYAPERQLLGQLKKDIFDAKGDLKDGAISKIANITGKGKEQLLSRMKEIVPDIDQRINVLKAVEDIERSSGLKLGTYLRGGVTTGAAVTGNIPVIVASILAQPQIAVPLLKGAGYVGNKLVPVLRALRSAVDNVNGINFPAPILAPVSSGIGGNKETIPSANTTTVPVEKNKEYKPSSDPLISKVREEVAYRESRGESEPYSAINENKDGTSDYGKYQVNEQTIKSYAKKFLGRDISPEEFLASPDLQEEFFDKAMEHLKNLGAKSVEAFLAFWHKGWSDTSSKRLAELKNDPSVQAYLKKPE